MNDEKYQIIQGDCLEIMKTFPDRHFDLVLTDPPYGINVGGVKSKSLLELPQSHLERVKVGIQGKSSPKVTGDLMTGKSPKKSILMKLGELVKIRLYLVETISQNILETPLVGWFGIRKMMQVFSQIVNWLGHHLKQQLEFLDLDGLVCYKRI